MTGAFTYTLGAVYGQRLFSQTLTAAELAAAPPEITIYDATHDPAVISIAHIEIFIEPITLADLGSGLLVAQFIRHQNSSDRVYSSGRGFEDGREAVLLLQFPAGARVLNDGAAGRYVLIEDMAPLPDSLIDTLPVLPGEAHQAQLDYFLPYAGELEFEQAFNNALAAQVRVTVAGALRVESDFLELANRAESDYADSLRTYAGPLALAKEPVLRFVIKAGAGLAGAAIISSDALLPLLGGGGAAMLAGGLLSFAWARRRRDPNSDIEALVKDLARLDEKHEQGQLNHDVWHQQRRELKAKLAELMAGELETGRDEE